MWVWHQFLPILARSKTVGLNFLGGPWGNLMGVLGFFPFQPNWGPKRKGGKDP